MKIILGKNAGFCWGVKRAMEIVEETAKRCGGNEVYTYGPLIHNQDVVDNLTRKGVFAIENFEGIFDGTVIIRTHGMPPKVKETLKTKGLKIVDATCPHVSKTQKQIELFSTRGFNIVIVGDLRHAEVISLAGHADGRACVVSSLKEARALKITPPVFIAAQSTFSEEIFKKIVNYFKKNFTDIKVLDSICKSATNRQKEVVEMAKKVDAMIVVGGANSANTKRLAQISKLTGVPTFYVENVNQLNLKKLKEYNKIGVTAGASTPDWVINGIIEKLQQL